MTRPVAGLVLGTAATGVVVASGTLRNASSISATVSPLRSRNERLVLAGDSRTCRDRRRPARALANGPVAYPSLADDSDICMPAPLPLGATGTQQHSESGLLAEQVPLLGPQGPLGWRAPQQPQALPRVPLACSHPRSTLLWRSIGQTAPSHRLGFRVWPQPPNRLSNFSDACVSHWPSNPHRKCSLVAFANHVSRPGLWGTHICMAGHQLNSMSGSQLGHGWPHLQHS